MTIKSFFSKLVYLQTILIFVFYFYLNSKLSFSPEFIDSSRHFFFVSYLFHLISMESCFIYLWLYILPKKEIESQLTPKIIKNSQRARTQGILIILLRFGRTVWCQFFCWGKVKKNRVWKFGKIYYYKQKSLFISYFCIRIFFSSETRPDWWRIVSVRKRFVMSYNNVSRNFVSRSFSMRAYCWMYYQMPLLCKNVQWTMKLNDSCMQTRENP